MTPRPPQPTMQPESSDGFASVGTILPKERAALLPGGSFRFPPSLGTRSFQPFPSLEDPRYPHPSKGRPRRKNRDTSRRSNAGGVQFEEFFIALCEEGFRKLLKGPPGSRTTQSSIAGK